MNVLLLKEPRENGSQSDSYIEELEAVGLRAGVVPVLSFRFVSLDDLFERMLQPEQYGGMIFTSPRAAEAVQASLQSHMQRWEAARQQWNQKPVYVVGKTTASSVASLGLSSMGEDSGNAEHLSQLIIQREKRAIQPLLFPCGSIRREVLAVALRANAIPLETVTVYETSAHPDLQENITHYFTQQGVPASVVFFSPSGVRFCLAVLKHLCGSELGQMKFASIGATTAEALSSHGLMVSASAEKPTAKHLAAALSRVLTPDSLSSSSGLEISAVDCY